MRWTDEQKAAIDTKNCKLLVAAGAGSGKTAVLVQRIIDKIIIDKIASSRPDQIDGIIKKGIYLHYIVRAKNIVKITYRKCTN